MFESTTLHDKLIKQIQKHPSGISTELLISKNNNNNGVSFALNELKREQYLSQLISENDKLRQVFELDVEEYTGDWMLTEKALAYIANQKLERKSKIINRFLGFALGVVSTILVEILILFINKKLS